MKREDLVIAVDAMSGDLGAEAAVVAVGDLLALKSDVRAVIFGAREAVEPRLARLEADERRRVDLRNSESVVPMDVGPRDALRRGRGSSMWLALDAVAAGEAGVAVSAGNTAALMAMAAMRLRQAENAPKPAIAALWPSRSAAGSNVVLDVGAGLEADSAALVGYAAMGAAYARLALGVSEPRIGLLNVGAEEGKGRAELRAAAQALEMLTASADGLRARFIGFVEGDQIPSGDVDVVVTDGFTGNVALKTAEGTARLIGDYARSAFMGSWLTRATAALAYPALRSLSQKMDPRRVNGGVFLGLNGAVVKSHGAADAVGFASALRLAETIGRRDLVDTVAVELAKLGRDSHYWRTAAGASAVEAVEGASTLRGADHSVGSGAGQTAGQAAGKA